MPGRRRDDPLRSDGGGRRDDPIVLRDESHRTATAALLRTTEAFLWPEVLGDPRAASTSRAELATLYPNHGAVPAELWMRLSRI